MSAATPWRHWRLERESDGLAWLVLDRADSSVNALSADVMAEFAHVLDHLDSAPPKGLIIRSAKPGGFVVGADIEEFAHLATPEDARALVERGWNLFARLARVHYPTLALIHGQCLGGGLELALACRYRVVADAPSTALALPEVMLGIFPGWGGMLRLPALIGAPAALDMMLTGRRVDARRAAALGLADARVPERLLRQAARQMVLSAKPARRARALAALTNRWPLRGIIAARARKTIAQKDPQGHYPAPAAIVEIWERHHGNALRAAHLLARIIQSPTARNLLRVFRLQERLKANARGQSAIDHVHVIGAGVMGADIAAWCAYKGLTVTLQDMSMERIAAAIKRAGTLFSRRLKDRRQARAAFDRLIPDPQGNGVSRADLVIEAISEQVQAKQALYRQIEPRLKPGALLATNTSSLSLATLLEGLLDPQRLVGVHFFNPVAKMPLVEVIGAAGNEAAQSRACAFVGQLGKLPLPVRDAPGFLVNAVLAPYMLEAMRCLDEGMTPETVDAAMTRFGMPMGPLELADTVGLDIVLAAGSQLAGPQAPPRCLAERIARGDLGRKTGQGFYRWQNDQPQRGTPGQAQPGLAQRLITPLIDRTQVLVDTGVVADADLADAGVIFGTGFAPFTGGPLHYRQSQTGAPSRPVSSQQHTE
ncbi:3-hydroxyacyl-CoA dehydrogenase NAD-binding domain-containing protein [Bordetella holmesii]|uniref:Enoyl-CoA hydratase/isomerase family protein n=2 Tax=Bordetella holmesii TaxID=35814 RepID=A0A158M0R0_9BORD|nr:3-hydroxyacyl-CoA dehydrogenase NAD-binding domain-containing protein [Bordetella holmesii]AHV92411.1 enoyl-CoA hydratase/isomerase family protein [Bordetella holmesii ATCC 51541]AIT27446.1 enoyl-CoA hydratase/isomerase family protein [Bordetella holmesii 44057]EWM42007.1 enoyl-CoA hydratase/isomerase family protein [Bordetella holmesii 41130]EWM48037.1 enoyl-CoA hydratase/isomerase family protein [Bordetella holmesii 35009]AMD46281.1 enoyl-CoA hydratase [Bordetella holmesii H558]